VMANVNRWREQVGLQPWSEEELQAQAEELQVAGRTATYVRLEGNEATILAAILPDGEQSWFFKLTGDPGLADQQEARFRRFVESVELK
jgi:hypothetical protein